MQGQSEWKYQLGPVEGVFEREVVLVGPAPGRPSSMEAALATTDAAPLPRVQPQLGGADRVVRVTFGRNEGSQ